MNLEELEKETEKLLSLLRNREPGAMIWNKMLKDKLEIIVEMAAKAGIKAK